MYVVIKINGVKTNVIKINIISFKLLPGLYNKQKKPVLTSDFF